MKNIGFLLSHLGPSQNSYYLIKNINITLLDRWDLSPIIFFENSTKPCLSISCGIMHASEIYGFDGIVIATSLQTADMLRKVPGNLKKYFYVWDLEWLRNGNQHMMFSDLYSVLHDVKIIPRSESHKKILKNNFNVDSTEVLDDWNMNKLLEIVK